METLNRKDKDSRERLASFMVKLSKGYTIYVNCDIEVMRAVIKKLGIPLPNPKRSFIKQVFPIFLVQREILGLVTYFASFKTNNAKFIGKSSHA